MNFSVDRELCVLPSGVNIVCVSDTAIRQAYYYTANILVWVGQQPRDVDVLLSKRTTEWVGVCGQGTGRCVII